MFQACLINNVYAELEDKDLETFENKTHLGIGIPNLMLKGYISRDLNRNLELGLNASTGSIVLYNFKGNRSHRTPFIFLIVMLTILLGIILK